MLGVTDCAQFGPQRSKGGNLDDHIYIRRGRCYNQLDQNELVEQIQILIESQETRWNLKSGLNLN